MPKLEKGDAQFIAATILAFITQDEKTSVRNIVLWPFFKSHLGRKVYAVTMKRTQTTC